MPTKKPGFFEVEGKEPPKPKKPTLYQFIKELKDDDFPKLSRVELLWFPGRWDNYSIETSVYRASITGNHPLYPMLEGNAVKVFESTDTAILLGIRERDGTLFFGESNFFGKYERIGNLGYRFIETPGAN